MDDDNADWLSGDVEPEPEPPKIGKKKSKAAEEATPKTEAEAPPPAAEPEPELEGGEDDDYLDPDKLLLFKHWIRPKFLPYKYITQYRHNYYDDVIDYLDKRNRGIPREIPVAQTWAERILRSYTNHSNQNEIFRMKLQDKKLVEETTSSGKFQLHHGKNYIRTRYSSILY